MKCVEKLYQDIQDLSFCLNDEDLQEFNKQHVRAKKSIIELLDFYNRWSWYITRDIKQKLALKSSPF